MTDFTKLHLVCQDFAVGVQSVNQALENNQALYERLEKRHAVGTLASDVFLGPGGHDDVLIARTVADFAVVPGAGGAQLLYPLLSGWIIHGAPIRLGVGQWQIYIGIQRPFSAVATIKGADQGKARLATCLVRGDSEGPYVVVSTWNVETPPTLTDYDFSLVLWSQGIY